MPDYASNRLCYVAESNIHGNGLFARRDIQPNTWIGHYDGPQTQENGTYVLWVEADAGCEEEWLGYDGVNELRFLNHARQPNGMMDGLDLYAKRLIRAGEEITIDYGEEFESSS